jgi:2-keto-4-pentenoate hydratase/2-oxohepta-3-ene-1,7-dioic acid hydratase in catechol pathway
MTTTTFARLALTPIRAAFAVLDQGKAHVLDAPPWLGGKRTSEVLEGIDAEGRGGPPRLAPVLPTKILCVGRNYAAHAAELGNDVPKEPLLFLKPPSALLGPDGTIELPPATLAERIEHEVELAVVVGARLRHASVDEARRAIFGLTCAGDITARDLQKRDGQWTRAKGMDTFCPVGPVVVTGLDPQALTVRCLVNDEPRQEGRTATMIFPVAEVLAYASQVMTLEPGDLVLTGTPSGVGPLADGDALTLSIERIGSMRLRVAAASRP